MSTNQLLAEVKEANQDYEWYPTTDEIIQTIQVHLDGEFTREKPSILDCGAGDGRVLNALDASSRYAIEKSKPLLNALSRDIFVVGTEFKEQTLLDKKVDVVFSNPPYSEFESWAVKIINEANANFIFLVIPARWQNRPYIKEAIEGRKAKSHVIGEHDFLSADRAARAKVHIVKIQLCDTSWSTKSQRVDPFRLWFEKNFDIEIGKKRDESEKKSKSAKTETLRDTINNSLVKGDNIVPVLEQLYQKELLNLVNTYKQLESVDGHLLSELDVNIEGIREALKMKIGGLKDLYWQELFNNLKKVTNKLTKDSRETLLSTLTKYAHVDFTSSNAYAIVIWVIKNANHYYDDQLVKLVERMTEKACVASYVSNRKTFGDEGWKYNEWPDFEKLTHYKLENRVVLARVGGILVSEWLSSWDRERWCGLTERAFNLIEDIRTVATNIGFDTTQHESPRDFEWESNKKCLFHCKNHRTGKDEQLMEVKAFKNGNLHIKFNPQFMCKLNVEFGRLKGWVKSKSQASDELEIPIENVEHFFGSNLQLEPANVLRLEVKAA